MKKLETQFQQHYFRATPEGKRLGYDGVDWLLARREDEHRYKFGASRNSKVKCPIRGCHLSLPRDEVDLKKHLDKIHSVFWTFTDIRDYLQAS